VFIFIALILTFPVQNPFGARKDLGLIDYDDLKEISGMASSRVLDDIFWVHNDSGNENKIFAIDRKGKLRAVFTLQGIGFIDTEDIAVGPGSVAGKHYVYLADIGDNGATRETKYIYRISEPVFHLSDTVFKSVIGNIDVLSFSFPDGKRDAETIMIDPISRDIVIVSKREKHVHVYSSPIPGSGSSTIQFEKITELPFGNEGYNNSGVTAGDISFDGNELLIKTYSKVYYYHRESGETLTDLLSHPPVPVDYIFEPQGESICFGADGEGFYTTSEMSPLKVVPHLYFYSRLASGINDGGVLDNKGFKKELKPQKTEIFNINGIKVHNSDRTENLNAGLYFLKYTFDDTAFIRKLLIVK
jgi:hypothetical protein